MLQFFPTVFCLWQSCPSFVNFSCSPSRSVFLTQSVPSALQFPSSLCSASLISKQFLFFTLCVHGIYICRPINTWALCPKLDKGLTYLSGDIYIYNITRKMVPITRRMSSCLALALSILLSSLALISSSLSCRFFLFLRFSYLNISVK